MSFDIDQTDAHILSRYVSQSAIAQYDRYVEERGAQPDMTEIGRIIENSAYEAIQYHREHCRDAAEHFISNRPLPF